MRNIARLSGLVLALGLVAACASDYVSYTPAKSLSGDVCDAADTPFACEGNTLKICGSDGVWAKESCESVCTAKGLVSTGACEETSSHGHPFCGCKEGCCTDGARSCLDTTQLGVCASCTKTPVVCSDYCSGLGLTSAGCALDGHSGVASCSCKGLVGGICPIGFVKCQEGVLSMCETIDRREAQSCRAVCAEKGFSFGTCSLDAQTPSETCECSNALENPTCKTFSARCSRTSEDKLTICDSEGVRNISCSRFCANKGLVSLGCTTDEDRGHDVCLCAVQAN